MSLLETDLADVAVLAVFDPLFDGHAQELIALADRMRLVADEASSLLLLL